MGPSEASAQAEVRELDVTVGVDEDVVRFDVAVDEAHLVHAVHGAHKLAHVKPVSRKTIIRWVQIFLAGLRYF